MNVIHHEAERGTRATSPARTARTRARCRGGAAPAPAVAGGHDFVITEDKGNAA
ncbi:hypothetical protein ACFYWP_23465 [Actinacidiphila glaucinigra]|uniref:hypothetical protein n=1 Tax=Actinacidiphila glaucinigra TaxID=235986 RepID=UPI00368BA6A1